MSEWKEHDGGECPVPCNAVVDAVDKDGFAYDSISAERIAWRHTGSLGDIVRYRLLDTPSSEEADDGGPAFPCEGMVNHPGMSLRVYIATAALQGMTGDPYLAYEKGAEHAIKYADALIAALAARKEK